MKKITPYIYASLALALPLLSACDDKVDGFGSLTVKEAKYANNRMELTLQDNETLPLTLFTMPRTDDPIEATYTSRHPDWLKVEGNVLTPALFSGGATIYEPETRTDTLTVSAGGLSVNYVVIITNHIKRVKDIKLTAAGANFQIKRGGGAEGTFNLASTISFSPADAYDQTVTYTSSDESIATVSPEGIVTSGDNEGTAVITIKTCDGSEVTRTANVTVLGYQPVDLDRTGWKANTSAAIEASGFNYIPAGISWIPDKVTVDGSHVLTGSPDHMFDGNTTTYFCMEKPGRGEYACTPGTGGWSGDNQDYGDMLTDLILSVGGDPAAGTIANPDADVTNYFIVDMAKEQEFSYVMWCHRNAANNRILTFDIYGSNDDAAFGNGAGDWTKLNAEPLDVSEESTSAAQRIDINNGKEFRYRYVKIVALSYPSSGMTFGISEFNLGVIR